MNVRVHPFWLNDICVRPGERELLVQGRTIKLEPKVMDVLLSLAARPGEVVTRDHLMQSVWPRMEVSEDVLSRSIYQLRKYLEDDSRHPTFIATIPKTGFELLVVPGDQPQHTGIGPLEVKGLSPPAWLRARYFVPILLLLGGLAWFALPLQQIQISLGTDVNRGAIAETYVPIKFGFFSVFWDGNSVDGGKLKSLALSLNDSIRSESLFYQAPGIDFRFLETSEPGQTAKLRGNFDESDLQYAYFGRVIPSSDASRALVVIEAFSRNGSGRVEVTPIDVFELPYADGGLSMQAARVYRETIVEKLVSYVTQELPYLHHNLTDEQKEGFRLLLHGERDLYTGVDCGIAAEAMLKRSLDLYPDIARTYHSLGQAYWTRVWECGGGSEYVDLALSALQRALELEPERLEAVHMYTAVLAELGRLDEAYAFLSEYMSRFPDAQYLIFSEIIILRYIGLLEESSQRVEQVLLENPLALSADMTDMPYSLLYTGDYARFLETAPVKLLPVMNYHRAYAHWRLGETDKALELIDQLIRMKSEGMYAEYGLALRSIILGDQTLALSTIRSAINRREGSSPLACEMPYRDAQLLAMAGDYPAALASLRQALNRGFLCVPCYLNEPSLAGLQSLPEMQALVKEARIRQSRFIDRFDSVIHREAFESP